MAASLLSFLLLVPCAAESLGPGNHTRTLVMGQRKRTYLVHVPPKYDAKKPTAVILAFHGAGMNGGMMAGFCGLSKKADEAGFVVVYPNGTGVGNLLLTWNAGGLQGKLAENAADDVGFVKALLDDLAKVVNVDSKRVFAAGMSNGAMMCYRLAAEMSDRIAAIAPVAGTLAVDVVALKMPVPVLHIHGTADTLVPLGGPSKTAQAFMKFKSLDDSIQAFVRANGCSEKGATTEVESKVNDGMKVTRTVYSKGKDGAEVLLYTVEGGGHTWPGSASPIGGIGRSSRKISANDLMWGFFQKHARK